MSSVKKVLAVLLLVVLIGTLVVSCKKRTDNNIVEIKTEKVDTQKKEDKVLDSVVVPAETKYAEPEVVVIPEQVETEQIEAVPEPESEIKAVQEVAAVQIPVSAPVPVSEVVEIQKQEPEPVAVSNEVAQDDVLVSKSVEQFFYTVGDKTEEVTVTEEPQETVVETETSAVIVDEVPNEIYDESEILFSDDLEVSEIKFNEEEVKDVAEVEEFVAPDDVIEELSFSESVAKKSDISELQNNSKPLFSLFASEAEPVVEPVVEEVKDDSEKYAPHVEKTIDELIDDLTALEVVKARLRQAEKVAEKRRFGVQFGLGVQYAKIRYQECNTSGVRYSVPIWFNFPMGSSMTLSAYLRPAYINETKTESGSPNLTDSFALACGLGLGIMTNGIFEVKFNAGFEFFNRGTTLRKDPCGLVNMQVVPCVNLQGTRIWIALPLDASFSFGNVFNSTFAAGIYVTYRSGEPVR